MLDRLGRRCAVEALHLPFAERAAARGQRDRVDMRRIVAGKALEDRVVLAIHRQQRRAGARHRGGHHLSGRNQRFLVGKRHGLATFDCGHGGRKALRSRRSPPW